MTPPPPAAYPRTFRQDVEQAALRLGIRSSSLTDEEMRVGTGANTHVVRFETLHRMWAAAPGPERPRVVEQFLRTLAAPPPSTEGEAFAQVRARLVPKVAQADYGQVPGMPPEATLPKWEFVPGHLAVFLMVDEPQTQWAVMNRHLAEWGVPFEEAYDIAIQNLRRGTDPRRQGAVPGVPAIRYYQANDSMDAARALLLGDLVVPWPADGVLFGVPSRDHLFYCAVAGRTTLQLMDPLLDCLVHGLKTGAKPVSDQLFWFDGSLFEQVQVQWAEDGVSVRPSQRFKAALLG